ncbi:hypothetical protein BD324DRAFT_629861 [Kockovaella imperatae]|uniref:CBF1-interacting co-repressor CIR N-terminal domain-containing protein n=1 Tax=Kockovaella imperatae TaxID=4999 RepID=A0A1Y1UES2_9TREE|nr:hypothetical protein BD324DRAFT_629861 [Kockovaella imperatae]ORX36014.1 hypothetical protein BD324DRAFT_629861 [Kockovaella imperatae]
MPRLQILQHKSYHPYLEKNKQRVREDEARAAAEELANEQRRVDAEASGRLDLLRRRAGSPSLDDNLPSTSSSRPGESSLLERHRKAKAKAEKEERKRKERLDFDFPSETARKARDGRREADGYDVDGDGREAIKWESGGHVNFFTDIEKSEAGPSLAEMAKKKDKDKEDPYTMYLARPDKETKPWYSDKDLRRIEEWESGDQAEERRARDRRKDQRSKSRNDPLTHITSLLSTHSSTAQKKPHVRVPPPGSDPQTARMAREQSERQRALALIAKTKAQTQNPWDSTPSTVVGRNWSDDFEREKDRAGRRYFTGGQYDTPERRRRGSR